MVVGFELGGYVRRATVRLDPDSSYDVGNTVEVIYDPGDPARVRTAADPNTDPRRETLLALAIPFVLMLLVGSVVSLSRSRRWRAILDAHPWQETRARHVQPRFGRALLWPDDHPEPMGVLPISPRRIPQLREALSGSLWLVDTQQCVVFSSVEGADLFEARPARRVRTAERWRRAFGNADELEPEQDVLAHAPEERSRFL